MVESPGQITVLLRQWRDGDRTAQDKLFESLMPELRKIARACFRGERPGHVLQPTALVNEAFLRLAKAKNVDWQDRGHFLALAARIMRRYLIDQARSQRSVLFLPIEGIPERILSHSTPLEFSITLDVLLDEMEEESPQRRAIVELKYFLGLTDDEAANALGVPLRTVQRDWFRAKRWLIDRLNRQESWEAVSNATSG
ncbi:MAG: ECF-type sigma factor [Candidatus Korobacteraceae bacterium]|jgi:RNA polymerase sigma factor (TIGR02999 family)